VSIWLDEAIPLGCVEPFHRPYSHFKSPSNKKERLNKCDSLVDLAASPRQKAVAVVTSLWLQ
ncbi:MAG TPA: hypothetical protein VGG55_00905, partial [Candidatus Acidoferrales bacterium]